MTSLGSTVDVYEVENRTQVADIDPSMFIEELDDELDFVPCSICGEDDNEDVLILCDGCEAASHTYCLDMDSIPVGHWFCHDCENQRALDYMCPLQPPQRPHHPADRRTRGQERRLRSRSQASWARVWQTVWDRLNLDLDFPYDDNHSGSQIRMSRREQTSERRDFREWERRLQVAERQGGTNRFRDTASTLLDRHSLRHRRKTSEPESGEEIRAWNALEKAREIQSNSTPAKRMRKSATASPSDMEPAPQPERRLKRPRTRRTQDIGEVSVDATRSSSASRRRCLPRASTSNGRITADPNSGSNGPSFLQSLLIEVEASAAPDETKGQTRSTSLYAPTPSADYSSPHPSSPRLSPSSSNYPSPRALSTTPPPYPITRPGSPTPLTSKVEPIFPRLEFSPSRSPPLEVAHHEPREDELPSHPRSASPSLTLGPIAVASSPLASEEASPARVNMSFSAKTDLQRMVSGALKPHYKAKAVSKDQYTDVNRNISRLLYNHVGDIDALDGNGREKLEKFAIEEVSKAVEALQSDTR